MNLNLYADNFGYAVSFFKVLKALESKELGIVIKFNFVRVYDL